jgi:hypothetical protein
MQPRDVVLPLAMVSLLAIAVGAACTGRSAGGLLASSSEAGTPSGEAGGTDSEGGGVTSARCDFDAGWWTCPPGYGDFPACPSDAGKTRCELDGGSCFSCLYHSSGAVCRCVSQNAASPPVWLCTPSETACSEP